MCKKMVHVLLSIVVMMFFSACSDPVHANIPVSAEEANLYTFFIESDISVQIEDGGGYKYMLSCADLYYRFYMNAFRSGVLVYHWEDANEIQPEFLTDFFTAQTNWNQTVYEDIYLPSEYVEPYIRRYFEVETEHLRKSMYYDISNDVYKLPLYPTEFKSRITDASVTGNILTIYYEVMDYTTGDNSIYAAGNVEIEIEAFPGHFRYIANEITFEK